MYPSIKKIWYIVSMARLSLLGNFIYILCRLLKQARVLYVPKIKSAPLSVRSAVAVSSVSQAF